MTTKYRLWRPLLTAFVVFLAFSPTVFAHQVDEYLQTTLVVIEPQSVSFQINLTPGIEVADKVLSQLDRDHSGAISKHEAAAYAGLLKRDLSAHFDGRKLKLKLKASTFPAPAELRTGQGIIQLEFIAKHGSISLGAHKISFHNRHFPAFSDYLLNAAKPLSGAIEITTQNRNANQSVGEIEFAFRPINRTTQD